MLVVGLVDHGSTSITECISDFTYICLGIFCCKTHTELFGSLECFLTESMYHHLDIVTEEQSKQFDFKSPGA